MRGLILFFFLFTLNAEGKTVLLTGYWPPTNEMLREFSDSKALNPEGWKGKNWRNSGYDIYAYFPGFQGGDRTGRGDFPVDYAATYLDFMRITKKLQPEIIISFGLGDGPWEIEQNFPPHYSAMFSSGKIPSSLDITVEDAIPSSLSDQRTLFSTLESYRIQSKVNASIPGLAWVDSEDDAGDYLCGFIAYLGAWYKTVNPQVTQTGFIHVNADLATAKEALYLTLEEVVRQ